MHSTSPPPAKADAPVLSADFFCNSGSPLLPALFSLQNFHAQSDWTTRVLDTGNEWRKFRAVPRLYPLRSLVCILFNKGGSRGAFRLQGAGGDHFHCTVDPSPGHIRCRELSPWRTNLHLQVYHPGEHLWIQPFSLQLELPDYSYAFLLQLWLGAFCLQFELLQLQLERFAYSGKVYPKSTSTDRKQQSPTVRNKHQLQVKNLSPESIHASFQEFWSCDDSCLYG